MSEMMFTRVWKTFPKGGALLTLMLALADAAGQNGIAELSMSQLATTTRMSRCNVWRMLRRLTNQGWIGVLKSPGGHDPHRFTIDVCRLPERPEQTLPCSQSSTLSTQEVAIGNVEEKEPKAQADPSQRSTSTMLDVAICDEGESEPKAQGSPLPAEDVAICNVKEKESGTQADDCPAFTQEYRFDPDDLPAWPAERRADANRLTAVRPARLSFGKPRQRYW